MSPDEVQIVRSTASIIFARCATGNNYVNQEVLGEARRALKPISPDPNATHWLYGIWDAPFVAEHGRRPFPKAPPPPVYVDTDPNTASRCANRPEHRALDPITRSFVEDGQSDILPRLAHQSFTRTQATPEYSELLSKLGKCLTNDGYRVLDPSKGGGVRTEPSWSEEQTLNAMLAEATCNDQLKLTQIAANIDAQFEVSYIASNRAELLSLRTEAATRVAAAQEVLHGADLSSAGWSGR